MENLENTGYYFCEEDEISLENLKLASYKDAYNNCKIKTPRICGNKTLVDKLEMIISQAELDKPVFSRGIDTNTRLWTGATRYNKTHFKDEIWISGNSLGKWLLKSSTFVCLKIDYAAS